MKTFKVSFRVAANDYQSSESVKEIIQSSMRNQLYVDDLSAVELVDINSAYPSDVRKSFVNSMYGKLAGKGKAIRQPTITYFAKQYLLPQDATSAVTGGINIQVACVEIDGERSYYVTEYDCTGAAIQ